MSQRSTLGRTLGRYLSEIIVIIIGITLSFVFDEWRNERKDRRDEHSYLTMLQEDLTHDTTVLGMYILRQEEAIRCTQRLASFGAVADVEDSLFFLLDNTAGYVEFAPRSAAFEELRQTGRTSLLNNSLLRRQVFTLYTQVYPFLKEWTLVDKTHVLSSLIPEITNHLPIAADSASLSRFSSHAKALQQGRLNYLLHTEASFKQAVLGTLKLAKNAATSLLTEVKRYSQKS
jgi:hypothetical protein